VSPGATGASLHRPMDRLEDRRRRTLGLAHVIELEEDA
jgi:hypothetical protein